MTKKKFEKRGKKALSPIIATVLLIAITVVIATIIYIWATSWIKEVVEKEVLGETKTTDKLCDELNLDVDIVGNEITINNNGNVPIYGVKIKKQTTGDSDILEREDAGFTGISAGGTQTKTLSNLGDYEKITIIPILLGRADNEEKEYTCKESQGIICEQEGGVFYC